MKNRKKVVVITAALLLGLGTTAGVALSKQKVQPTQENEVKLVMGDITLNLTSQSFDWYSTEIKTSMTMVVSGATAEVVQDRTLGINSMELQIEGGNAITVSFDTCSDDTTAKETTCTLDYDLFDAYAGSRATTMFDFVKAADAAGKANVNGLFDATVNFEIESFKAIGSNTNFKHEKTFTAQNTFNVNPKAGSITTSL